MDMGLSTPSGADGFGRLQEVEQQKREPMRAPSPPKLRRNR